MVSHVKLVFSTPRDSIDALFSDEGFTDQFYNGEDTRLEVVYPIRYGRRVEDLRVAIDFGLGNILKFEGARIATGMKLTPLVGQFIEVKCKIKVLATREQSGALDDAINEWVDLSISPMNEDLVEAAKAKAA